MQDYNEFIRKLRAAASHVGQRITAQEAERRMTAEQIRHRRGQNFMTQERLEYRALAGNGNGPIVVEISHGVFADSRLIGITVYHSLPEFAARDHDESGCCFSVGEAAARLRELNGGGLIMAEYRNPWHESGKPYYGPAVYSCDAKPIEYRGFLIYRQHAQHWDVVRDGTAIGQYAGLNGARGLIDLIHDNPTDFWAVLGRPPVEIETRPVWSYRATFAKPDGEQGSYSTEVMARDSEEAQARGRADLEISHRGASKVDAAVALIAGEI